MRWTDNHCHIDPDELQETVSAAVAAGVQRCLNVGTSAASSAASVATAAASPHVWATVGVHPHDSKDGLDGIEALLGAPGVVAVGECGLDYHYNHSPPAVQQESFAAQIEMAHRHGLPLVVHTREAWEDTFAILDECGLPERTVFHCFTGGPAEARAGLERGGYLSFSGIATFKSADDVREAAALCPLDRMLVETDAPFLAPEPRRGTVNTPANLPLVGAALARCKGLSMEEVAGTTWDTATAVYGFATGQE